MLAHIIIEQIVILMVEEKVEEIFVLMLFAVNGYCDIFQSHQLYFSIGHSAIETSVMSAKKLL